MAIVAVTWGGLRLSQVHGIAAIWVADAIVLAVLVRVPVRQWPVVTLVTVFAYFLGNELNRQNALVSFVLPSCNLASLLAAAGVLHRLWGGPPQLSRSRTLIEFCIVGGALAPAVSASCATVFLSYMYGADAPALWRTWFFSCSLGILTLGPSLLSLRHDTLRDLIKPSSNLPTWGVLLALSATVVFAFMQSNQVVAFVIFPALLLAAFRLNFVGMTLAPVLTVALALGLTLAGFGPFTPSGTIAIDHQVQLLQLLLAGTILTTLPVASALAEREELQRRLREAMREAQNANKAKSEFLASMSHELRTPLNAVIGFAQMMLLYRDNLTEKQREYIGYIQRSGNQLLSLITDVLDFARIEAGDLRVDIGEVDVESLLAEVAATIRPLTVEKGLILSLEPVGDMPPILADRARLLQVLLNLCSNAVKYNRRYGAIGIRAERTGQWVRIVVSDTGIGIPAARQREVFQPFNRLGAEAVRSRVPASGCPSAGA